MKVVKEVFYLQCLDDAKSCVQTMMQTACKISEEQNFVLNLVLAKQFKASSLVMLEA